LDDAVSSNATDVVDSGCAQEFTPISWAVLLIVPVNARLRGLPAPRFNLPPTDLVVKFCHFTC